MKYRSKNSFCPFVYISGLRMKRVKDIVFRKLKAFKWICRVKIIYACNMKRWALLCIVLDYTLKFMCQHSIFNSFISSTNLFKVGIMACNFFFLSIINLKMSWNDFLMFILLILCTEKSKLFNILITLSIVIKNFKCHW